jgi:hypothetical protein
LIMEWRSVGYGYLRTWFVLDFVSSVPIDRLLNIDAGLVKLAKLSKIARVFHVVDLKNNATLSHIVDLFHAGLAMNTGRTCRCLCSQHLNACSGIRYLVLGTKYQVPPTIYLLPGTSHLVPGAGYLVAGTRYNTCYRVHVPAHLS